MWNFIKDFADMVPEELGTPNGNDGILGEFNTFFTVLRGWVENEAEWVKTKIEALTLMQIF